MSMCISKRFRAKGQQHSDPCSPVLSPV